MAEQKHSTLKQALPLYTPAGFYMLRAPVLPARTFLRLATTCHVSSETPPEKLDATLLTSRDDCYRLLIELAGQPEIAQALVVASPSLVEGLERLRRGESSPARQKRAYAGLLRYIIRMSTRPTPFGLFSGVAQGNFANETQVSLASPPVERFRTRPDMSWLLAVLHQLEKNPDLVSQLDVTLNQMAYLVGERAVLPFADTYGRQDNRAISLRATSVVRKVFELARYHLAYTELRAAIQQAFPRATEDQVARLLWQLWEHGFLISQLHPPLTDARPAEYVQEHLNSLQGVDATRDQLQRVLDEAAALDCAGWGAPITLISTLVKRQEVMVPAHKEQPPLQVDTALRLRSSSLNAAIGQAAARAAEFLLRQTPYPTGFPHLQEYRTQFLEKYGERAEVPLLDLLSPENGLDAPPEYEQPSRTYQRPSQMQPQNTEARDRFLLGLVTEAVNKRSLEVELTGDMQQRLERWSPAIEEAPLSLEIYLQIHAQSRTAIDRGEWTAVVSSNCGSPHAGRTFGRFFDLLGDAGIEALQDLARREETLQPDVVFAELSYQPQQARLANVAIRPPVRSYEIAVGTTLSVPPERALTLSDLVVGIADGRFYLRSLRLGKQVRVCQSHMLNPMLAPNVCRFISEVAMDGVPALSIFDWGAAIGAPFLPRVVIQLGKSARLVLAPARWNIQAGSIVPVGEGSTEARWFQGLQEWRKQWRVPRYVYLVERDNRLLLDLEHPLMATELRDELSKQNGPGEVMLDELLPGFEHLWLRDEQDAGYFAELVVPLLRTDAVDPAARPADQKKRFTTPERIIMPAERSSFPGEEWIYLKLYAALSRHEEIIATAFPEIVRILQEHELIDRWFFIRYADPEPHLRLRFHAQKSTDLQSILGIVLSWSLQLARRDLIQRYTLDTYEREIERYGGPEAIALLEQVFTVDSAIVNNIIAAQYTHRLTLDTMAVAVFTLDHFFAAWGYDLRQRLEWRRSVTEKQAFSKEFRSQRKLYCDLCSTHSSLEPDLARQQNYLLELVQPQEALLKDLGAQVDQIARAGKLWVPQPSLLNSLAHMHINRLLGIDGSRETQVYAFWRQTLDSLERRPGQEHPLTEE